MIQQRQKFSRGGRSAPCRLGWALCALQPAAAGAVGDRVAIRLIVRILDPSREFYAARLASGNQPTKMDVSAANTATLGPSMEDACQLGHI